MLFGVSGLLLLLLLLRIVYVLRNIMLFYIPGAARWSDHLVRWPHEQTIEKNRCGMCANRHANICRLILCWRRHAQIVLGSYNSL